MIFLRPHHGLCIHNFEGYGYSEKFVYNMQNVIRKLEGPDDVEIKIVVETDSICIACPHNESQSCTSGQKVLSYDEKVLELCNIRDGEIMTWKEFKNKIEKSILSKNKLKDVCTNCEWLKICVK